MHRDNLVATGAELVEGFLKRAHGRLRRPRQLRRRFQTAEELVPGQVDMVAENLVTKVDVERNDGDASGLLLLRSQVRRGIRDDPDHEWSIASRSLLNSEDIGVKGLLAGLQLD